MFGIKGKKKAVASTEESAADESQAKPARPPRVPKQRMPIFTGNYAYLLPPILTGVAILGLVQLAVVMHH